MERLTTDNPRNNTEVALNLVYVKDGQAWVRNGGSAPGYPDVELYDYMRLIVADHGPMSIKADLTDDELGDALYDALFDGIETKEGLCAMLYTLAWAFAELRQRLAAYEDTGLTPEEIRHCLNGSITAEEAKVHYNEARKQYDEWFAWKQAESDGRLVVLPCKVGSSVYTIKEDFFNCEECEHKSESHYNSKIMRRSCNMDNHAHCPLKIVEHTVGGFEVFSDSEGKPKVSEPGEFGCEGLMEFSGYDLKWYLTREEVEKALEGMGNDYD